MIVSMFFYTVPSPRVRSCFAICSLRPLPPEGFVEIHHNLPLWAWGSTYVAGEWEIRGWWQDPFLVFLLTIFTSFADQNLVEKFD